MIKRTLISMSVAAVVAALGCERNSAAPEDAVADNPTETATATGTNSVAAAGTGGAGGNGGTTSGGTASAGTTSAGATGTAFGAR